MLCFGRANKVFFPFFNKISCKLSFQESVTKGSNMFCLAIKCCCSRAKILQEHSPKKFGKLYPFFNIIGHSMPQFGHTYHQMKKNIARYFANHSFERVPQWGEYSAILPALFGLKYCNIPSLPTPASPRAALDIYNFNIQPHQL